MERIDLEDAVWKLFEFRPDDVYSLDFVYRYFQKWGAEAWSFRRGEYCIRAGMPTTMFAIVLSGVLHLMQRSDIGDDILMRVVRPGEYVGLSAVFIPQPTHPADIVAGSNAEVVFCPIGCVRQWRNDPESRPLYDHLTRKLCEAFQELQAKCMIMSGDGIAERLRRYLAYRMKNEKTRTVSIPGTLEDLANYLGVNRCALSRTIGQLRAEGKIEYRHHAITVLK